MCTPLTELIFLFNLPFPFSPFSIPNPGLSPSFNHAPGLESVFSLGLACDTLGHGVPWCKSLFTKGAVETEEEVQMIARVETDGGLFWLHCVLMVKKKPRATFGNWVFYCLHGWLIKERIILLNLPSDFIIWLMSQSDISGDINTHTETHTFLSHKKVDSCPVPCLTQVIRLQ